MLDNSESIQIQVERATATNFLNWFNQKHGRGLRIICKQERPDFLCADNDGQIGVEVTLAYHNQNDAKSIWTVARNESSCEWSQVLHQPEDMLSSFITSRIGSKVAKGYGKGCFLVVRIPIAPLTEPWEIEHRILPRIEVHECNDFEAIYVTFNQSTYYKVA